MKRFLEKLVERFWEWCESVYDEPEERLDPPHEYARKGTLADFKFGNACLYCWHKDPKRRAHNDRPCRRPYRTELA